MGRLSKLAFWRKGKSSTPIEAITLSSSPSAAPPPAAATISAVEADCGPKGEEGSCATGGTPRPPISPSYLTAQRRSPSLDEPQDGHRSPSLASLSPASAGSITVASRPSATAADAAARSTSLRLPHIEEDAPLSAKSAPVVASPTAAASPPPEASAPAAPKAGSPAARPSTGGKLTRVGRSVTFELPLEDVWEQAKVSLGHAVTQSLQSPKWDRRVEALKSAGAVIKGSCKPGSTGAPGAIARGLAAEKKVIERAQTWRVTCQVLNHMLCDKVMPVRLASHELFLEVFSNTDGLIEAEEVTFALGVLIQHPIDRLGDSNLRLHESARKCVLFAAEHEGLLGLRPVLKRLQAQTAGASKADRTKVHFGILDTVNFLLQEFPGHRSDCGDVDDGEDEEDLGGSHEDGWTQHDVSPFIIAGMDDALGARVRTAAVTLAVTVYQTFGLESMQPMLAGMRPAKQALLKQKFDESEWDEHDIQEDDIGGAPSPSGAADMGLMVCGMGLLPQNLPALPLVPYNPEAAQEQIMMDSILKDSPAKPDGFDEEMLMDGILEDTGAAFADGLAPRHGAGMQHHPFGCLSPREPPLEKQLQQLGLDLGGLQPRMDFEDEMTILSCR